MLPFILGVTFSMPFNLDGSPLIAVAAMIVGYLVLARFIGPGGAKAVLSALSPKAADFLLHVDRLGIPFLAPVLQAVAAGDWKAIPDALHDVFDVFTKTETRRGILLTLAKALLRDQLTDPNKKGPLLDFIKNELGFKITE